MSGWAFPLPLSRPHHGGRLGGLVLALKREWCAQVKLPACMPLPACLPACVWYSRTWLRKRV